MGSSGVDESDREGIPDGTDFFHAAIIDRSDLSGASYFVSREKIAELLEFDSRRFMGVRPKIGGTDARIQGEDACVVEVGIENSLGSKTEI